MSDDVTAKLSRWSQRKHAARSGQALPETEKAPVPSDDKQQPQSPAGAATSADADMPALPPIEQLTAESDYTGFLAKKVPEALQQAALRKLWASDPVFGVIDGLDHYNEDYNVVDTLITAANTSYRPGRGYLSEAEEKLEQELLEAADKEKIANASADKAEPQPESTAERDVAEGESDDEAAAASEAAADAPDDKARRLAAAEPNRKGVEVEK